MTKTSELDKAIGYCMRSHRMLNRKTIEYVAEKMGKKQRIFRH